MVLVLDPNSPDPDAEPSRETRRANRADLRSILFAVVQDLSRSDDDQVRLRASLGGLRALAQLDTLDLRERRLEQHDKMIALAENHLALQQQRAAAKSSGSPSQREGAGGRASSSVQPAPAPLTPQELAELKDLTPEGCHPRHRIPSLANYWRNHLIGARFWGAYWQGHKSATNPDRSVEANRVKIPGVTKDDLRPSPDPSSSEISDLKFSPPPSDSEISNFKSFAPPSASPPSPSEISDSKLPSPTSPPDLHPP